MNRIFYPIMLMAYGFFVLGIFARANAGEINYDRNLMRDMPRAHLIAKETTTSNNTERSTAGETTEKSSVEGSTQTEKSE